MAARAILVQEAIDVAEELERVEMKAAALWQRLWGYAFAALPGGRSCPTEPLNLGPLVSKHINAPPRTAHRQNLPPSTRTERGQQEVARVRVQFDALLAGIEADEELMDAKEEPGPSVA